MGKPFEELRERMSPESRARSEERTSELLAEIGQHGFGGMEPQRAEVSPTAFDSRERNPSAASTGTGDSSRPR
jgi:hypothetical protein